MRKQHIWKQIAEARQERNKRLSKEIEWPAEFTDVFKVLDFGASKYAPNDWLREDCPGMSHKDNCASMFRHLSKHVADIELDDESNLDHLLHIACRALMAYTRKKRTKK